MKYISKAISSLLILFFSFISVLPAHADGIKGNGNVQSENREVPAFETIKVNGAFTIILSQNDDYSLKVVADENLMEIIKTIVKGDVLYISTEKSIYKSKELKLYIGFKHLSGLKANGAISLKSDQMLRFDELDIEINGASSANLELTANQLRIDNSGASTVTLAGKCDEFSIDISGAGSVSAYDLIVKKGSIDISGVGSGKICVEENLRVSISGIGSVKYKGNPKITSDISFLGSLKKY
ncbi:hypothetical protein BZG02_09400 [Labilibaculum filiforme]|uniref:Putative auto-transporter adhesin head GIN domain-containing protein n=1 Tax=Labilibaculum filiforme TaxID=1940526 RepID=A0A2N3HZV3_9BACT|nr:head GIN domain-containing protein [Labilibaculum filiforme]PKQ63574.1 hypothetical protein BZG02_09400 [Labilibaculum filiforme]